MVAKLKNKPKPADMRSKNGNVENEKKRLKGRPTDYDPSFCDKVVKLANEGHARVELPYFLQCTRETINQWMHKYPDFSDAVTLADEIYRGYLFGRPHSYGFNNNFGAAGWQTLMRYHCKVSNTRTIDLKNLITATTPAEMFTVIKDAVASGEITCDEAAKLSVMVTAQVKINENDKYEREIAEIKQSVNDMSKN